MEEEDPTTASSAPPAITVDATPTASSPMFPEKRDPDDDHEELDGEDESDDEEEKVGEAEHSDPEGHSPSPITNAKSPDPALAVGIPIPKPGPATTVPAASGREDCWSEDATWTLIEAWGERHLRAQAEPQSHQRGGLRQKDWEEVADAVCSRGGGEKQAKSEGQCKNRIDTLKKKYKVERVKAHSSWSYFRRLNDLLAADYEVAGGGGNGLTSKLTAGVGFGSFRHQLQQLQMKKKKRTTKKRSHRQILQSVRPPHFLSPPPARPSKEEYSSDGLPPANGRNRKKKDQKLLLLDGPLPALPAEEKGVGGPEAGLCELARAVMRLGEVYERVENTKLRQAEEMENRRMGLAKELEDQRMDFFTKTLVELTQRNHKKLKRLQPGATENHLLAAPAATNTSSPSNKSGDSSAME